MSEEKICPQCGEGKIFTINRGSYYEHSCDKCDYQYVENKNPKKPKPVRKKQENQPQRTPMLINLNFLKVINKFSGILIIMFVILLLVMFTITSGEISDANTRINFLRDDVSQDISCVNTNTEQVRENITGLKSSLNTVTTRISNAEDDIEDLHLLNQDIADLENSLKNINKNISNMQENISNLWFSIGGIGDYTINLTFVYYANQTTDTRYCHFNFTVESIDIDFKEVKFGFRYDKINISLLNWTGNIKPQQYQWTNGNFTDNYYLHWFGFNNKFYAKFNMSWNVGDYNTSKLPTTNLQSTLMINSVLVDVPSIWEEEVA